MNTLKDVKTILILPYLEFKIYFKVLLLFKLYTHTFIN